MSSILYCETTGTLSNDYPWGWKNIAGLQLILPAISVDKTHALIILNIPNPYATGSDYPGGNFGISDNGTILKPIGCFTYDARQPESTGRRPLTLVAYVKLLSFYTRPIAAVWSPVRSSTVFIDSPSSLSAIIS